MSSEREPPNDQELEAFLEGRHPVARAYREASDNETAPPELDTAILAAAREAVRTPVVRRPRWVQPVALAATLVLGVSVLMNVWRDPVLRDQVAAPPTAKSAEAVSELAPVEPAARVMTDEVEKKKAEMMKPAEAPRAKSAPPPPPALAPVLAPEPVPQAARSQELESRAMEESKRRQERKSEADFGAAMSAPADAAADVSAPKALQRQSLSVPAAPSPARSIEAWIEEIRALRARGDTEAAERELRAFRLAYPDHALPNDLKAGKAD